METAGFEISTVLATVIGAVVTLLVGGITTFGGIYLKKLETRMKMRDLTTEINRYVDLINQAKSFQLMSGEEKTQTILEQAIQYADTLGVIISERQLSLIVEKSVQSLRQLEVTGNKIRTANLLKSHRR